MSIESLEFCKKHGAEINTALLDPATAKWLIEEYVCRLLLRTVRSSLALESTPLVRTCTCGRKVAGNVYFKHAKACKLVAHQPLPQAAYESSACGKALGGSI